MQKLFLYPLCSIFYLPINPIFLFLKRYGMKITGEHLQFLRTLKKVKQPVLARKLGVKQQSISKLENKLSVCDERFHEYIAALNLEMDEALSLLKLFTPPR